VDGRKGVITRKITKTATSRELTLDGLDGPVSADKRVAEIMFQLQAQLHDVIAYEQCSRGEIRRKLKNIGSLLLNDMVLLPTRSSINRI
jgi:hypothetical protein